MLQGGRLAADVHGVELDDEGGAGVEGDPEESADGDHLDAELLGELAVRRLERGLSREKFSSRELPQAGMTLSGRPPGEEQPAVAFHHGREDSRSGGDLFSSIHFARAQKYAGIDLAKRGGSVMSQD